MVLKSVALLRWHTMQDKYPTVTEDHVEPTALNFATPPIGQSPCRSDGTIPKDFIL